jgi:hypothetical protein
MDWRVAGTKLVKWAAGNAAYNWLVGGGALGAIKLAVGALVAVVGGVLGVASKLPAWGVFMLVVVGLGGGIWIVNGILYLTEQRRTRKMLTQATHSSGGPPTGRPPSTAAELGSSYIRDRTVRISEVPLVDQVLIRGKTFENCTILGPAVLVSAGPTSYLHSTFVGTPQTIFWEHPDGRVVGAIGTDQVNFITCWLQGIGLAGPAEDIERWTNQGFVQ